MGYRVRRSGVGDQDPIDTLEGKFLRCLGTLSPLVTVFYLSGSISLIYRHQFPLSINSLLFC